LETFVRPAPVRRNAASFLTQINADLTQIRADLNFDLAQVSNNGKQSCHVASARLPIDDDLTSLLVLGVRTQSAVKPAPTHGVGQLHGKEKTALICVKSALICVKKSTQ
jgi:hypothetical protein